MTYLPSYLPEKFFETRNGYFPTMTEAEAQAKIDIAQDLLDLTGKDFLHQAMCFESRIDADTLCVTGHISLQAPHKLEVSRTEIIPHNIVPLPPRPWTWDAIGYWICRGKYAAQNNHKVQGRHEMLLHSVAVSAGECLRKFRNEGELRLQVLLHWRASELSTAIELLCCASDLELLALEASFPEELVVQTARAQITGEWAHRGLHG